MSEVTRILSAIDQGDPQRFNTSSNPNSNDNLSKPTSVAVTKIALTSGVVTCNAAV
jgi:hypothetical protein